MRRIRARRVGGSCGPCGSRRQPIRMPPIAFLEHPRPRLPPARRRLLAASGPRTRPTARPPRSSSPCDGETMGGKRSPSSSGRRARRDHLGRIVDDRRAFVVGVCVRPAASRVGCDRRSCSPPPRSGPPLRASTDCILDVHRDNHRAQGAYRRAGFEPTGETLTEPDRSRDRDGTGRCPEGIGSR